MYAINRCDGLWYEKKKKKEKGQSLDNSGIPEFTLQATNRA